MKGVCVLGSTGSIGVSTLNVIAQHPDKYNVVALAANSNVRVMTEQCLTWRPAYAVMADTDVALQLQGVLRQNGLKTEVLSGGEGLEAVARLTEVDYVMAAIVGAAGLLPTLAAARAGKRVMLANKEALVMSGRLFMDAIKKYHAELLPIDSEHNAIFQCMPQNYNREQGLARCGISKIMLTASGGPFRNTPLEELHRMTPAQACAHPNWVMGRKISVDSATMMNKGLEVIEACWLFDSTPDQIQVVLHAQSVIHSLVEYVDGSVLAQLGNPDMRTPIAHALAWPDRVSSGVSPLDLFAVARLDFEPPDETRYPCLRLARQAMRAGGTATAILNAANEIAVKWFLSEQIRFTDIARVVEATLDNVPGRTATALEIILEDDQMARTFANDAIKKLAA